MKQLELKLGGLFVLQMFFAATLFWYFDVSRDKLVSEVLITSEKNSINKLVIHSDEDKVVLELKGKQWNINGNEEIFAAKSKVDSAIEKLAALKTNWPVATTASSHQRFEVSPDKFQRKIELFNGENLVGELYFGTSPGFKKVHIRRAGDNEVYAQSLNNYDFPVKGSEWLDKSILSANEVKTINREDYQITKKDAVWQWASSIQPKNELNAVKAESLGNALSSLRVLEVSDKKLDFSSDKVINLEVEGEKKWQYQFVEENNNYYVRRSDRTSIFKLSQYEYNRIAEVSFEDLKVAEKQGEEIDTQDDVAETKVESSTEYKDS